MSGYYEQQNSRFLDQEQTFYAIVTTVVGFFIAAVVVGCTFLGMEISAHAASKNKQVETACIQAGASYVNGKCYGKYGASIAGQH